MTRTSRPNWRRGRRTAAAAAAAGLVLAVATGAALGLGLGPAPSSGQQTAPQVPVSNDRPGNGDGSASPTVPPAPPRPTAPTPTIEPVPEPEPVLEPGDRGPQVRELQARLHQLAWYGPVTSATYAADTRAAVHGFQDKRGFEATGVVDERTWRRLGLMTRQPTEAEVFNRPGPTLYGSGAQGAQVREIQARLRQIAWYFGDVTGSYGAATVEAVAGFQTKRGITSTGAVDQRTLNLLEGMTSEPTADALANRAPDPADGSPLDPRCTTGQVLCIDKSSHSLRWVVDGTVRTTVDVRFGSQELPTREGVFSVYRKSRDHVSSLYDTSMPFAMFFSGGQAVHYSPDFAANGYSGASHGCVNVRDYSTIASLFEQVPIGARVVVYWS